MCPALLVKIRLGWKCDAKKFYEICLWNAPAASLVGALQKFVIKRRLVKLIGQGEVIKLVREVIYTLEQ